MGSSSQAKRKPRYVYARVQEDGDLRCEDEFSRASLRTKKIKRGMRVRIAVSKERDYGQWKKAHELGTCITQNIDEFEQFDLGNGKYDAHGALKHLQKLSGVECDDSIIDIPNGKLTIREPRSLAFDEMEECRFQEAYAGFCAYLRSRWWADMDDAAIEQMASLVGMGSP